MSRIHRKFAEMYVEETMKFFLNSIEATKLHIIRMFIIKDITEAEKDACFEILEELERI